MDEKIKAFEELCETSKVKEILEIGEKIKKLDKSMEKRTLGIILISVISMTVLGFISFGFTGSILFFAITVIASFWLFYSSKKNTLLKYLTFYRNKIPQIIGVAEGVSVKSEDMPRKDTLSTIHEGKPVFRMCHKYDDIYMGFLKFMSGDKSLLQGFAVAVPWNNEGTDFQEKLKEIYSDFVIKKDGDTAILFIPGFDDYLGGRLEMIDDLSLPYLTRQYRYYLLADAFGKAMIGEAFDKNAINEI